MRAPPSPWGRRRLFRVVEGAARSTGVRYNPAVVEPSLPDHLHGDPNDGLVFRRGKLRKREDDEVRMMREALANLADVTRVKRILLELGRFYNPVTNAPVVGPSTRRHVVAMLETGDPDGARDALEAQLAEYLAIDDRRGRASPESLDTPV
jgi:hypothetical protein